MAKYREIAADIRERRLGREFAVGDKLPGIPELQRQYDDVALNTVRAALNLLAEEKLLRIEQGLGTFVIALPEADSPTDPLAEVRSAHAALGQAIADVADEVTRTRRDALFSAADDLEAMRPTMDIAKVPAWLRDRAAHHG